MWVIPLLPAHQECDVNNPGEGNHLLHINASIFLHPISLLCRCAKWILPSISSFIYLCFHLLGYWICHPRLLNSLQEAFHCILLDGWQTVETSSVQQREKQGGEVKGSLERSPSEEKRKTNGIAGMRSIWFYCLSGQVQERRIAKGKRSFTFLWTGNRAPF